MSTSTNNYLHNTPTNAHKIVLQLNQQGVYPVSSWRLCLEAPNPRFPPFPQSAVGHVRYDTLSSGTYHHTKHLQKEAIDKADEEEEDEEGEDSQDDTSYEPEPKKARPAKETPNKLIPKKTAAKSQERLPNFLHTGEIVLSIRFVTLHLLHPNTRIHSRDGFQAQTEREGHDDDSLRPVGGNQTAYRR